MKRNYYPLNERLARQAHDMNSMMQYKSDEPEYRAAVDEAYELAEQIATNRPQKAEEAERIANSYAYRLAEWYNKQYSIDAYYPSILISGGGNFDNRKKSRQNARRDANREAYAELQNKIKKLEAMANNKTIYTTDPDAIEQMERKLTEAEKLQDLMKRANAYYRKHGTLEGSGLNVEYTGSSWGEDRPFQRYELSNNNANIRRMRERLEELKAKKEQTTEKETIELCGYEVEIVRNTELDRLQIIFDCKPDEGMRSKLKSNGFRWSPKNTAWQRQLTKNAEHALRYMQA